MAKPVAKKSVAAKPKPKAARTPSPARRASATAARRSPGGDKKPRIFTLSFGSVYPLYVQKAEKKGRTKEEVDQVIAWLTGYGPAELRKVIEK